MSTQSEDLTTKKPWTMKYRLVVFALFAVGSLALTGCSSMSERWRDWAHRQDEAARKAVEVD